MDFTIEFHSIYEGANVRTRDKGGADPVSTGHAELELTGDDKATGCNRNGLKFLFVRKTEAEATQGLHLRASCTLYVGLQSLKIGLGLFQSCSEGDVEDIDGVEINLNYISSNSEVAYLKIILLFVRHIEYLNFSATVFVVDGDDLDVLLKKLFRQGLLLGRSDEGHRYKSDYGKCLK